MESSRVNNAPLHERPDSMEYQKLASSLFHLLNFGNLTELQERQIAVAPFLGPTASEYLSIIAHTLPSVLSESSVMEYEGWEESPLPPPLRARYGGVHALSCPSIDHLASTTFSMSRPLVWLRFPDIFLAFDLTDFSLVGAPLRILEQVLDKSLALALNQFREDASALREEDGRVYFMTLYAHYSEQWAMKV